MNTAYQRERRARLRSTGARVLFSAELHPATHEALRTLAKRHGSTIRETLETLIRRAANG